jgi:adenosylcobinamide-GDP ribazoletransferase
MRCPRPLRPLAAAIAFLTRLPVLPRDLHAAELGRSVGWFPAAGLVTGGAAAGVVAIAGTGDPPLIAIAIVALGAFLTGGLHLDGVADVADGLGGGRGDRQRTLAIMRDSRIGAFGAIALVLLLLAKVQATAAVVRTTSGWPLLVAPVVARAIAALLVVRFPYARAEGLGRVFHDEGRPRDLVLAAVLAAAVVTLAGPVAALASAAALAVALALAVWIHRRLGGLTGDACGAAIEVAELTVLVIAGH